MHGASISHACTGSPRVPYVRIYVQKGSMLSIVSQLTDGGNVSESHSNTSDKEDN
jgi:hypothetical protein